MSRKPLVVLLGALLALVGCTAAPGPSPSPSPALPTPTIGLTYIPNVQFSPFYVAETDGHYTEEGVQPILRHHGTSEGLFTAIAAGQEQFVIAGGDELMQARAQGVDLVAVATYFRSYPVVMIVPADSPIRTLADLRGHTIGLPGKYGESWFGLLVALKSAGLTEADVKIAEIGYTQQPALTNGRVDAVVGFSNNDAVQFALAGVATRSLPIASGEVPLVGACLITTHAYASAHPDVVKAVVAGTMAGITAVVEKPERALEVSAHYVPDLDTAAGKASATATLAATKPLWTRDDGTVDATLDEAQWSRMADFLVSSGITANRQDPTAAMTNSFIPAR
ncbi:MAG: ABC transporter substrate-binding protein [Propionibacteriaceae bacterium]|jgi:NitT/TauT family transport system substrate-binding protein|nr:ABC transporter substrate-binding protein [Propionibacteriaceae bacterium]